MSLFWGNFMKDRERLRGASHSEQTDHIQDSIPPVSSTHASTRNDERVSMSPRAEAEIFERKQHSTQTQPAAPEREASSVEIWEYKRLKDEVDTLTKERNDLREENSQLREALIELRELKEKEEHRREQKRKAQARYRQNNRDKYYDYHNTYMQEYRANRKDQEPKPEADLGNSKRSSN